MKPDLVALIPAAGRGSRMGGRKLELPWGGTTILGAVLDHLRAGGLERVVVVVGPDAAELTGVAVAHGAGVVVNEDPERGMLSSIHLGLAAAEPCDGAVILPGDFPLVRPDTIAAVAARAEAGLVIPVHEGRRGHPIRLASRLFAAVLALPLEAGLRALRERVPDEVAWLEVDDPGTAQDVDTPADYARFRPPDSFSRTG
ncbi:MAG: nucleotidyltransferase family protein [Armatimonadetes bacterium]|nr:nucleotidyltransferase family protein [Armatimonadota bacterium]